MIWKPIGDWPGYEVSDMGLIRNTIPRIGIVPKILKPVLLKKLGYMKVTLCAKGQRKDLLVHRIVATVFLREPLPGEEVNHKNFIKSDNWLDNLEWTTKSGNSLHAVAGGRKFIAPIHAPECRPRGESHGCAKLNWESVNHIRESQEPTRALANQYKVSISTISRIRSMEAWTDGQTNR